MTEEEAEAEVVRLFRGDSIEENCGPNDVLGQTIWEIWVTGSDRRMATRFLLDDGNSVAKEGFRHSEKLFAHLNDVYKEALRQAEDVSATVKLKEMEFNHERQRLNDQAERANKRFTTLANTFAALGGFIICLAAFIYMIFTKNDVVIPATLMAASVLVTCCTFLFGKFIILKLDELFGRSATAHK